METLWKGQRFAVRKDPGGRCWGGRGSPQTWVQVSYQIRDLARNKPVKRITGRQTKTAIAALIAEAQAMDAALEEARES